MREEGKMDGGEPVKTELEEAWNYVHQLTVALTGLTCGGSEFFIRRRGRYIADVKECVDYVRRRDQDAHERTVKLMRELKALQAPTPPTPVDGAQ